jgi:cadmium resistance protein CadD (predicted permease)
MAIYGITQDFLKQINIVNILIAITVIGFSVGSLILHYQGMKGSLRKTENSVLRTVFTRLFLPRIFVCLGVLMLIPKNILELKPDFLLYLA